jgi:ABC-type lipoprotein release transport system permease subunit
MVDTDNVHFINFREIKKMTVESVEKIMILLDILVFLLFVLSFYQLLLSLEANMRDSKWQIGVLRAMGMTKVDI